MTHDDRCVGITTTVPVEVIFAADLVPVDLNNVFVASPEREEMMNRALEAGFPQGSCAWIKGIFGAVVTEGGPSRVIGVVRGDCSGTEVLLEALELRGIEVVPFAYPLPPAARDMRRELARFAKRLGTTLDDAEEKRHELAAARELLALADALCWSENRVTGAEAHRWLVSSSDFDGDPGAFSGELALFIEETQGREPLDTRNGIPHSREVRLGYIGVPPIEPGIFEMAEQAGARFVFHEVQRQFSMPFEAKDLVRQYLLYTYPYSVMGRVRDINEQARARRLDGLVHYVQSFCHRNMEDAIFSSALDLPLLTIECDCPGGLGAAARSRLESFIQILGENV
jgi:benzoyl-CoA reductase/2-hydroxyglutaryl-CoA dehydratase subunit BcrC/BadD/HgdB